MAIRQYIGARYVPKYIGHFDSTREYEPLSVVDDANGNSYTSKIPVPAGSSLDNTRYWAPTGNFSGAVTQLQNRMTAAEGNITDLQNVVDPLPNAISELSTEVNNKISDNEINSVSHRKYLFLGDSYGESYEESGVPITGWLARIGAMMGITGQQMVNSFAESGYGFVGSSGKTWMSVLSNIQPDTNTTDVVIVGGSNDLGQAGTDLAVLKTAIRNTVGDAKTKFPNAKIWIGFCSYMDNASVGNLILTTMQAYQEVAAETACAFMGDLVSCLFNRDLLLSNNTHPNNEGTRTMAMAIASILKGGSWKHVVKETDVIAVDDGQVVAERMNDFKFSVDDNTMHLRQLGGSGNYRSYFYFGDAGRSYTTNGNAPLACRKLTNIPTLNSATEYLGSVYGKCEIQVNGTRKWYDCIVDYVLWHNYIEIIVMAQDENGWITGNLRQVVTLSPVFSCNILIN